MFTQFARLLHDAAAQVQKVYAVVLILLHALDRIKMSVASNLQAMLTIDCCMQGSFLIRTATGLRSLGRFAATLDTEATAPVTGYSLPMSATLGVLTCPKRAVEHDQRALA